MRRATWAVCAFVLCSLVACIEARLVPCGDQSCPRGSTCVAGALCASDDQIAACEGIEEGGACSVNGGTGRCDRGVCIASGCGNNIVDPGEACDDGGQESGDGCRADCIKFEVCGDAIVDDGEGCDDGNTNAADGCDGCVPTAWRATAVLGGNASATAFALGSTSLAVDRAGNVYLTEGTRIRRIDTAGILTTVAGNGTLGFGGDGGPATSAQLLNPDAVAIDGLGNLYIADTGASRVRQVDPAGIITGFAGTGVRGNTGDNGAATSAQLFIPRGLVVDGLGNVFIADSENHRVRRVDLNGIITPVAGTGVGGFAGDDGPATTAQLLRPSGLAIDAADNLYIADTDNHRVRRVDAITGIISTVAGTGTSGFSGDDGAATGAELSVPVGLAIDAIGNLYIADSGNHRIRRVNTATGVITTVAGTGTGGFAGDGGAATSAALNGPRGVAFDGAGNLYIADPGNARIRRVDTAGTISTIAGSSISFVGDGGAATCASITNPYGVATDGLGVVYIAETGKHRIRRVDASGVITTVAGTGTAGFGGDGGAATSARLDGPESVGIDSVGNIYVTDTRNHRVRRVDSAGTITTIAGTGVAGYGGDNGPAVDAALSYPTGIAIDGVGNLYIADTQNHRVRRVDPAGTITTVAGTGAAGYSGDSGNATSAQLATPDDVAVDAAGNLYIADTGNNRIRRVDPNGIITTFAGTGVAGYSGSNVPATTATLYRPSGVAVDDAGAVYIADTLDSAIRRVDTGGIITTVAGRGTGGDGGLASVAFVGFTYDVAVGGGSIYIADTRDGRVRRVSAGGLITTVAGAVDPEGMGPSAQARLADPRAFVVAQPFTLVAGGSFGRVQAVRTSTAWVEVVAGRYTHGLASANTNLARFRPTLFGAVAGVAYDAAAGLIYFTEPSANQIHVVTIVDIDDETTWPIAPLVSGAASFADGPAASASFRGPTGLYFDATARQLYVADTGNHVVRAIDLSGGVVNASVRTVAGTPATRGFYGDGGIATDALLYAPQALTRCGNGDMFIADTGSHRVRRVAAADNSITTVLGVGIAASSGEGRPASTFPVDGPLGLACDASGNLFVTSSSTVRLLPADASGIVDGTGSVQTIYGAPPHDRFPSSVTRCLTGLAVTDTTTVQVTDACTGLLVELHREPTM